VERREGHGKRKFTREGGREGGGGEGWPYQEVGGGGKDLKETVEEKEGLLALVLLKE